MCASIRLHFYVGLNLYLFNNEVVNVLIYTEIHIDIRNIHIGIKSSQKFILLKFFHEAGPIQLSSKHYRPILHIKSAILTAVTMQISEFYDVTSYSLEESDPCFGGMCFLYFHVQAPEERGSMFLRNFRTSFPGCTASDPRRQ